jgi:hypothetical protein
MKTETIVSASPVIIRNLSVGEATQTLKTACQQLASFAEKGCKYIGLLRGQLVASGENPEDVFSIVKDALIKGGMDEKRAKSTANNGKPHSELAEFTLKGEGSVLKESHFYGLSVENARKVVPFLRKGGDEAIDAINKIKLDKSGKLSSKALEKLIPSKEGQVEVASGDGDGGDAVVEDGTNKSAYDRAVILLTSIQSLMKEMTGDEADAVRQLAVEFILD